MWLCPKTKAYIRILRMHLSYDVMNYTPQRRLGVSVDVIVAGLHLGQKCLSEEQEKAQLIPSVTTLQLRVHEHMRRLERLHICSYRVQD